MIEPVELNETALIIGDNNFPVRDEDRYVHESEVLEKNAQESLGAAHVNKGEAEYTGEGFRGETGTALTSAFAEHQGASHGDAEHYLRLAAWMKQAAENIVSTKNAMNEVTVKYHEDYASAQQTSRSEGWPQTRLSQTKRALVDTAHKEIQTLRTRYESTHARLASLIAAEQAHFAELDSNGDSANSFYKS